VILAVRRTHYTRACDQSAYVKKRTNEPQKKWEFMKNRRTDFSRSSTHSNAPKILSRATHLFEAGTYDRVCCWTEKPAGAGNTEKNCWPSAVISTTRKKMHS
jgi:hypothetical protein